MKLLLEKNKFAVRFLAAAAILGVAGFASAQDATPAAGPPEAAKKADMTVVVVATRLEESPYHVAGTTDVVTLEKAKEIGAITLGDTLKYVPGVSVPFSGGAISGNTAYGTGGEKGINVRGLEGNRVAILADGIRQPDDFTAGAGGGFPTPGRIYFDPAVYSQVEIFKSASSSFYGSGALSGVVGVQSVSPETLLGKALSGNAINNVTSFASANMSINNLVQGAVGDGKWAGSVVYSFRDGNEAETNGGPDLNPTDFTSNAVIGKVVRKFESVKLTATVDYFNYSENVNAKNSETVMNMGPTMRYIYGFAPQDNARERLRVSLGAEIAPVEDVVVFDTLNLLGYRQDSKTDFKSRQFTSIIRGTSSSLRDRTNTIKYDTEIMGFTAVAKKQFEATSVAQTLQYGIDFSYSDISSDFDRVDISTAGGTSTSTASVPTVMAPSSVYRFGLFASDKIEIGESRRFALLPSLRVDYYDVSPNNTAKYVTYAGTKAGSFENWSVSPGISAMYNVTPDINIFGLYAMGTRNPSADELNGSFTHSGGGMTGGQFITTPNPDLKDETSNNFEFGVQGNLERHAFRVSGFYNIYDNFIEANYNTGRTNADGYIIRTSRNLDEAEIYGVETRWDWNVDKDIAGGIDGFQTGLAFAWTEGRQETAGYGRQPLSSVDPYKIIGYIGYVDPTDKWGVRLSATFVGRKGADDISQSPDGAGGFTQDYDSTDSYFLLDLVGFYRLNDHWSLNAGINNLTDEKYITWSSARSTGGHGSTQFTQPGINGFVSVTATF